MAKVSVRRLHNAPEENIITLAEVAGDRSGVLRRKYLVEGELLLAVYGADDQSLKLLQSSATEQNIQMFSGEKRDDSGWRPAAVLAGPLAGLSRLADKINQSDTGFASAIVSALDGRPPQEWSVGGGRTLDLARPLVMGVLNLTPDSFYSGSRVDGISEAVRRARQMAADGADIIDLGGESTRPGAQPVSEQEEIDRVTPVVEALAAGLGDTPISVDTYKASVAGAAVGAGASIINDIGAGLLDEAMLDAVARSGAGYVMMHMRGTPRTMQQDTAYDDLLGEIHRLFAAGLERCSRAGIAREKVILDPGIGFGKTPSGNYELIVRLREFFSLGCALLVGASRKSFLTLAGQQNADERLEGSLAACVASVINGASIVRVHDVAATRRAVDTAAVFAGMTRD